MLLRARHPGRSRRRANCVEPMDSTLLAPLELDPAATLSATQSYFDGLMGRAAGPAGANSAKDAWSP